MRLSPLLALGLTLTCCTKPAAAPPAAPAEPEAILIGEVGALTGSEASFGLATRDGVSLAVEELNADGGVRGRPVRVRVYDSQGRPEEAASATQRLVTQDKVLAIIGENASSCSLAMAPIAQAAKVVMISPSSTNPQVTAVGSYIFRACFLDDAQGAAMARHASGALGLRRVALLTDVKSAYSEGLAAVFAERFVALGGTIVARQTYAKGDTDFRSQLTALKALKPEALYVPGYYQDAAAIAEQARELGVKVRLLGSDGWSSRKLLELGGSALDGALMTDSYAADDPAPASRAFIERFSARYGHAPNGNAALGYDAARLLFAALQAAPALEGPAIRDALARLERFPGAAGEVSFDERRNPVKPVILVGIQAGEFKYLATVPP